MVASFNISTGFTAKVELAFVLTQENAFSKRIHFKANRKRIDSTKTVLGIFKIDLRLRSYFIFLIDHVFMWQSLEILNVFYALTLKQILGKTQTLFKKLEYRFLVENTKIENAAFPYKAVLSEANVKTNKMWSFASNYFIFSKILFQFENLV